MKKKIGDYIIGELIGSGTYGEVYKGLSANQSEQTFAIKMISKKNIPEKVFNYLEREVEILHILNHPNVVKLIDIRATENHYYLILEYCNGGDLSTFRKQKGGLVDELSVKFLVKQIVEGLNEVYNKNAIHRDIKLSNILLSYPNEESRKNGKPIAKIGDFGFGKLVTQLGKIKKSELSDLLRISSNTAPELFSHGESTFKSDIWSLGIMVYELLCGRNCYLGMTKEELIRNINNGVYEIPKKLNLSIECLDFINVCLQFNPKERIDWKDLMNHPFVCNTSNTPFNPDTFEKINKISKEKFENNGNYILNSKLRYSFPTREEFSKEENKEITGSKDTMDINDLYDDEFIKVDESPMVFGNIKSYESNDYIVLSSVQT